MDLEIGFSENEIVIESCKDDYIEDELLKLNIKTVTVKQKTMKIVVNVSEMLCNEDQLKLCAMRDEWSYGQPLRLNRCDHIFTNGNKKYVAFV